MAPPTTCRTRHPCALLSINLICLALALCSLGVNGFDMTRGPATLLQPTRAVNLRRSDPVIRTRSTTTSASLQRRRQSFPTLFVSNDDANQGASAAEQPFVYVDDCFGLISLSTAFVANDIVFSLAFVLLSTITAVAANTVLKDALTSNDDKQVPGAVALATLLLVPFLREAMVDLLDSVLAFRGGFPALDTPSWAPLLEAGVTLFSFLYGFVLSSMLGDRTAE